jgi:Kef-type K+ transport system membrane component KefB
MEKFRVLKNYVSQGEKSFKLIAMVASFLLIVRGRTLLSFSRYFSLPLPPSDFLPVVLSLLTTTILYRIQESWDSSITSSHFIYLEP